jgi:hypothetical protein
MQLNKNLNGDTLAVARYAEDGIALSLSGKEDKYANSIAILECVDGKLRLTLFDDAIERYGVEINDENVEPENW